MNILVTLNSSYIKPLCVMLYSLMFCHPETEFDIYVVNKTLTESDFEFIQKTVKGSKYRLHDIKIQDSMLTDAPISSRYPYEMYYRIFASAFLPENVDRILYLDPDLVVLKSLEDFYLTEFGSNYFAAASHVNRPLQKFNEMRLNIKTPYINSGVMLMNISLLRAEQNFSKVFDYIDKNKRLLFLPDQDIISAVYGDKIITVDPYIYNMTERMLFSPKSIVNDIDFKWVRENSAIVHYCGRNKPWKDNYYGILDVIYKKYALDINI